MVSIRFFLAAKYKDFWCNIPDLATSVSNATERFTYLPKHADRNMHSQCTMYNASAEFLMSLPRNSTESIQADVPVVPCQNGWEYDKSFYQNSIVAEWSLVCDKQHYPTIALICLMMGAAIGTPIFGFIADRWGRKLAYFICICTQLCGGITTGFSHNFAMFCFCRFVVGATYPASWSIPFTLAMEIITPKYRASFAAAASISYNLGAIIVVGIAYWIQNWREFALATCVPLSYVFIYWCFMPESPRWLLTRKRIAEVQSFLFKVARCNGTRFEPLKMENVMRGNKDWDNITKAKTYSYFDLVCSPNLRKKTILLSFINCANLSVYLGLSYYSPSLGSNPFLSYTLYVLVEIPAYIFVYLVADRFGRRLPTVACLLCGGAALLGSAFVPDENSQILLLLGLIGKLCISASFTFGEIYEQELFPTVVRSQGASLTQNISNAVACVFPLVNYLGDNYLAYPVIIFGGISVIAGFSALFLPETLGTDLPQSLEDGELFGRNMTWRDVTRLCPAEAPGAVEIVGEMNNRRPVEVHSNGDLAAQVGATTTSLLATTSKS
ncbi:carcinine transporter-like isoform X2 [Paramacrobiotus metropolitanus]|uniref:carcinine transporter-like isoform X2 n=1 Tax=Paramacrobiotus metropolitanus TaxID=2943436 RepID=UPI002445BC9E|nr:carcinine transporter-like isoform X2 [Paramacrobiotus metropolitanus]